VFFAQIVLLVLLILNVVVPKMSTSVGEIDTPMKQVFFPANVSITVRVSQFVAVFCYLFFLGDSLSDLVKAFEGIARYRIAVEYGETKYWSRVMLSCMLRFLQAILAIVATMVLILTASDVVEIVLNFATINYISSLDEVAFDVAKDGRYGVLLKEEADRIENEELPKCVSHGNHGQFRFRLAISLCAFIMIGSLVTVSLVQMSKNLMLTQTLRIQFLDGTGVEEFSGCYGAEASSDRFRLMYNGFNNSDQDPARLEYCKEARRWRFFVSDDETDVCTVAKVNIKAESSRTDSHDISSTFEETWYSASGITLEAYFFEEIFLDGKDRPRSVNADDPICSSYLGNGRCDDNFNSKEYEFDAGDCCSSTCIGQHCGYGTLRKAFNTREVSGDGFPSCIDPVMQAVTIFINDVTDGSIFGNLRYELFHFNNEPLMSLECDGKHVLSVSISKQMIGQWETAMTQEAAECRVSVRAGNQFMGVEYIIFHGNEPIIDGDAIEILQSGTTWDNVNNPVLDIYDLPTEVKWEDFNPIPKCYFTKLSEYIPKSMMYTGSSPGNNAIRWLLNDSTENSNCEDEFFIERYALSIIESERSPEGWSSLSNDWHCTWPVVTCYEGAVIFLDLGKSEYSRGLSTLFEQSAILKGLVQLRSGFNSLTGTIPTMIGNLKILKVLRLEKNGLTGSIPKEISLLPSLEFLRLERNGFNGTIPTQIASLTSMLQFTLNDNELSGTIPKQIGSMTILNRLYLHNNHISGSIPTEIGFVSSLERLSLDNNILSGTIPKELGSLTELLYLDLSNNFLTGTIPKEVAFLTSLTALLLANNSITGSVPSEILSMASLIYITV